MSRFTGCGRARLALRSRLMRLQVHRRQVHRTSLVIGLAVSLFASGAGALNAPEEEPLPQESTETYATTPVHDDYDPRQAAHPLRIVAYAVHPVGVALDWIIVRPAVWVGRHEPFRTIFGFED